MIAYKMYRIYNRVTGKPALNAQGTQLYYRRTTAAHNWIAKQDAPAEWAIEPAVEVVPNDSIRR